MTPTFSVSHPLGSHQGLGVHGSQSDCAEHTGLPNKGRSGAPARSTRSARRWVRPPAAAGPHATCASPPTGCSHRSPLRSSPCVPPTQRPGTCGRSRARSGRRHSATWRPAHRMPSRATSCSLGAGPTRGGHPTRRAPSAPRHFAVRPRLTLYVRTSGVVE
eukprot:scaffold2264_cov43-Tisochrysis_lutea.AAC.1